MNSLQTKLNGMLKPQPVPVSADEIEQGYVLYLRPMKGGELCYWREKTIDSSGSMFNASVTEKLMLGIALCLVDKDGEKIMIPDEYQTLNDVPLPVLDRLIQTFLKINNLGTSDSTKSADENDLKNSSEAIQEN